jgi:hypothetical protein
MRDRISPEWRNSNSQRKYPFSADASMMPDTGIQIREDAFIDAVFYPINLAGVLYLSAVNRDAGTMEVSDDSGVRGTGAIGPSDVVQFLDDYGRPVGTIVTGPGFLDLSATVRASAAATTFAAACVFPQNQVGLRGLLLPDGTLVTGDITLAGEDGIRVDTTVEDGNAVIRLMAVGVPSTEDCINLPPPVKCLKIKQLQDSTLTISQNETAEGVVIGIGARLQLSDVCPGKLVPGSDGNLPLSHDDLCDEDETQPVNPGTFPGFNGDCPASHNGRYFIIPLSDLLSVNPSDEPAAVGASIEGSSTEALQEALDRLPPRDAQAIEISVRGY